MGRRFDPSPNQAGLIALTFLAGVLLLIWVVEG